jgi:signal transduction histidine kinase
VLGIVSGLLRKTLRSWTFKLALIWIGIFGAVVIALFGYVYWSTSSYVLSRSDHTIAIVHALLHKSYELGGRSRLTATIEQYISEDRFEGGMIYLLTDESFTPVAGNLKNWPAELKGVEGWKNFSARAWKPDAADRPVLRAIYESLPDGFHLLVGKDISDLDGFASTINTAIALVLALLLVIASLASISVTRRTVGRIEAINATSLAIMQRGLGTRISLRGTRDEWDKLAENLNLMLDRIQGLMAEMKQMSENIAHDLRTPLTRMRARLEKAWSRQRNPNHDQFLIEETMKDLDGVLRIFSSLMRISQIETSDRTVLFRTVNLATIASEVVELFDAAAEEKGTHLSLVGHQQVSVQGDRDLLFDGLSNLVDNAIKHGRDKGEVVVEVVHHEGFGAILSVIDNGPGIPVDERANVFKRFYRLQPSRGTPGNGLGLSVVAAVARLHGADIKMFDNMPGLKLQVRFPAPTKT